jgi:maleylacetoacetate isomerase
MRAMPSKLVLYSYWRSSSAFRVRFALNLKGIAYETKPVNLLEGAHLQDEHKARSPLGVVPCLEIDGEPFVESVALVELLDELFPEPPLYPKDPFDRARVRALVELVNADTQPLQNMFVLKKVTQHGIDSQVWARDMITRGFEGIERLMAAYERRGVRGPYAYGAALTAADAYLVPQMYNAERFKVDLAPFPRISRAVQAARDTDAARRAAPEVQPDAPQHNSGAGFAPPKGP